MTDTTRDVPRIDDGEIRDWLESLDAVIDQHGLTATGRLLQDLTRRAEHAGVQLPFTANTPYLNTIQPEEDPAYPGDRDLEQRLKSLIRWNALAMVVRANRHADGIGGHISDSTTFSGRRPTTSRAISSTTKATRHRASTPAPIWRGA